MVEVDTGHRGHKPGNRSTDPRAAASLLKSRGDHHRAQVLAQDWKYEGFPRPRSGERYSSQIKQAVQRREGLRENTVSSENCM